MSGETINQGMPWAGSETIGVAGMGATQFPPFGNAQGAGRGSADVDGDRALQMAVRLLSETGHDLRTPLTGVREAVRLVHDGHAGTLTDFQRELLGDAMSQCDVMEQLADNMLQLERLRSDPPAAKRRWFRAGELFESQRAALDSLANAKRIAIHWRGFQGMGRQVFGDPEMLGRILTNLVGNAVVVSDDRSRVRIALEGGLRHGTVRLSVTDSGPGMTPAQVNELSRRGQSGTGSTGLGLAISRALAAQHFTRLTVRSRLGEGTRVGLELPAAGPASVADTYVRYRELVRVGDSEGVAVRPRGAAQMRAQAEGEATGATQKRASGATPKVRVDGLHRGAFKEELMLPLGLAAPRFPERVQAIQLRVVDQVTGGCLDALDDLIQREQRLHELVYRTHARRWVLFWDADQDMVAYRRRELERGVSAEVNESHLQWTEPQAITVGDRTCAGLIRETLVRDTLHAHRRTPIVEDRPEETESLHCPRAEERLEAEFRRLGRLIRRQSERLQQQATLLDRLGDG